VTHRKVFTISRRVDRDGVFMGAAVVVVPIDLLAHFWVTLNLGPGSVVSRSSATTAGWSPAFRSQSRQWT
jgi:hypothetical protein